MTVYEDLTKEECWRVSNLNNNHSEEKADITFQVSFFFSSVKFYKGQSHKIGVLVI